MKDWLLISYLVLLVILDAIYNLLRGNFWTAIEILDEVFSPVGDWIWETFFAPSVNKRPTAR